MLKADLLRASLLPTVAGTLATPGMLATERTQATTADIPWEHHGKAEVAGRR
jgi:hypothetical protein